MVFVLNCNPSYADRFDAQENYAASLMIGSLVADALNLLMNIYIVVKGRKASKNIEPAVAGE